MLFSFGVVFVVVVVYGGDAVVVLVVVDDGDVVGCFYLFLLLLLQSLSLSSLPPLMIFYDVDKIKISHATGHDLAVLVRLALNSVFPHQRHDDFRYRFLGFADDGGSDDSRRPRQSLLLLPSSSQRSFEPQVGDKRQQSRPGQIPRDEHFSEEKEVRLGQGSRLKVEYGLLIAFEKK